MATPAAGTQARFRTWFPFREWRFESSLRHLVTKGLTTNNVVSPFRFPNAFGEILGKTTAHIAVTLAPKEAPVTALELRNKTYCVVFMYGGKKYAYSLDT